LYVGRLDKRLDEAKKKGWTVISVKNDWKQILSTTVSMGGA
jgi:hypothetical protein